MRARRLIGGLALAVCALLLAGCSVPAGTPPPAYELFTGEQRKFDRLPDGSPALWSVFPGTTRSLGELDGVKFFVGLSARDPWNPFCIIVSGGPDDAVHCGSNWIGAVYLRDLRFGFDANARDSVATENWFQLAPHLVVELEAPIPPEVIEIPLLALDQQEQDLLASDSVALEMVIPETTRLAGELGGYRFFLARSRWVQGHFCVVAAPANGPDALLCGGGEIRSNGHGSNHPPLVFSPEGFPPQLSWQGWSHVGDHLMVEDRFAKP